MRVPGDLLPSGLYRRPRPRTGSTASRFAGSASLRRHTAGRELHPAPKVHITVRAESGAVNSPAARGAQRGHEVKPQRRGCTGTRFYHRAHTGHREGTGEEAGIPALCEVLRFRTGEVPIFPPRLAWARALWAAGTARPLSCPSQDTSGPSGADEDEGHPRFLKVPLLSLAAFAGPALYFDSAYAYSSAPLFGHP